MLYLMRKLGESIIINDTIEVKVVEVKGKAVKLGFTFPPSASILRKEIHDKISEANVAASMAETDEQLDLEAAIAGLTEQGFDGNSDE